MKEKLSRVKSIAKGIWKEKREVIMAGLWGISLGVCASGLAYIVGEANGIKNTAGLIEKLLLKYPDKTLSELNKLAGEIGTAIFD